MRRVSIQGFRKVVPDRWEFSNDFFRRGEKRLLCDIHRRKIPTVSPVTVGRAGSPSNSGEDQVASSTASPPPAAAACGGGAASIGAAELVEENERLRKENAHLARELSHMKSLCDSIFALMADYADRRAAKPAEGVTLRRLQSEYEGSGAFSIQEKAEEETSRSRSPGPNPRLFGVSIGAKRAREEEAYEEGETQGGRTVAAVKSEPLESRSDHPDRTWLNYSYQPNQRVCNQIGGRAVRLAPRGVTRVLSSGSEG
ncbi:hypothetical protein ACLOJK_006193 [Asimina triloba]